MSCGRRWAMAGYVVSYSRVDGWLVCTSTCISGRSATVRLHLRKSYTQHTAAIAPDIDTNVSGFYQRCPRRLIASEANAHDL
jgi:hypothetical protein